MLTAAADSCTYMFAVSAIAVLMNMLAGGCWLRGWDKMTEMISILNSACVQLIGIACGAYILKCAIPEGGMQRSARKALDIVALTAVIRIITGVLPNGR